MTKPIVDLIRITKNFGPVAALHEVTLDIRQGEILTLLGPSGCGKTTLMRLVAGFMEQSTGQIRINGEDMKGVPPERRPVNMVFQRYALFPHLDVFDNVAFGLRLKKVPRDEIRKAVHDILELVQLQDFADRWITELSGGQAQRVALARALVNRPSVLLLDEPLAALDLKIRQHMVAELKRIHDETQTTFLYVTHDQDEAMMLSDRIVLLNNGRIEQIGTPEEMYASPASLFCAQFLGDTNFVPCRLESAEGATATYDTPSGKIVGSLKGAPVSNATTLSIRPEALSVSTSADRPSLGNRLAGRVESAMFIGSRIIYAVRVSDTLVMKCQEHRPTSATHPKQGDQVFIDWRPEAVTALAG
jgi:spermidine/putrescine transport system ATP-binding protein